MNRKISAVIGANFGDEGKGLITDFLAKPGSMVVRFNGGAQAGHTVQTRQGRRHVFSHIGSGTLNNSYTYLAKQFIVNPMFFTKEFFELLAFGAAPIVYVDSDCLVTMPYDMMINQALERRRGKARHGSCGVGINETVERSDWAFNNITADDLKNESKLREKFRAYQTEILEERLESLRLDRSELGVMGTEAKEDEIMNIFVSDCSSMSKKIQVCDSELLTDFEGDIVFEGAQGLKLDQDHYYFPFVTRSNTGMCNVHDIFDECGFIEDEHIDIFYTTRTYITRHGEGPLDYELDRPPYPAALDFTNLPNEHQGKLRYALPEILNIAKEIKNDVETSCHMDSFTVNIALTCADQIENNMVKHAVAQGDGNYEVVESPLPEYCAMLVSACEAEDGLVSFGPTREDVKKMSTMVGRWALNKEITLSVD